MSPSLNQVSFSLNGWKPMPAQDYARNSLIFTTKLMTTQEFKNLKFQFSKASGEGGITEVLTSNFGREKFHKVEDESSIEVMFKMAALADIRFSPHIKARCQHSINYQLICEETDLVRIQKDLVTGKIQESIIQIANYPGGEGPKSNSTYCKLEAPNTDPVTFLDAEILDKKTGIKAKTPRQSNSLDLYRRKTEVRMEGQDNRAWKLLHDVPSMNPGMAYGAFAANVIIPGSGTMIGALQTNRQSVRQT